MNNKNLLLNKGLIAITAFLIGILTVSAVSQYKVRKSHPKFESSINASRDTGQFLNNFFNNDFFDRSRDPFEEMRRMRNQLAQQFSPQENLSEDFNDWYLGKFGGDVDDIKQREDDQFIYYDIDLRGQKPQKLDVTVKDGQVFVTGQMEKKNEDKNTSSYESESFQRSFPVPYNADPKNVKTEQQGDKLVIKFAKKIGANAEI